jgi:hypothetical protein
LGELDRALLEIVSPIVECFVNIESVQVHGWPNVSNLRESSTN